jgi:hypothetical protein
VVRIREEIYDMNTVLQLLRPFGIPVSAAKIA